MSRTRVKICGLTHSEDRDVAIDAGADALGFISQVPVETPRSVVPAKARDLVAGVPPFVTSVLVTMPDTPAEAATLQEQVDADTIQIHGTLTSSEIGTLRESVAVPVVAAVDIEEPALESYAENADAVLVDSTSEDGGGGTGETHDWEQSRELVESLDAPLILAGGLTPDNVSQAIGEVGPFAVDTASGVEREGGIKDHDAVRQFVRTAQSTGVPA